MQAPAGSSATIEKRVSVRVLGRLGTALATELGAMGLGGGDIAARIETCVAAECLVCGIEVSGVELMGAALAPESGEGLSEKQRRLRLGYCARKTCQADFYTLHLRPAEGVDWNAVWDRTEAGLGERVAARAPRVSLPVQFMRLAEPWVRELRRPVYWVVVGAVVLFLWMRSGFRVPGISPPPRVFVVPADPPGAKPVIGR